MRKSSSSTACQKKIEHRDVQYRKCLPHCHQEHQDSEVQQQSDSQQVRQQNMDQKTKVEYIEWTQVIFKQFKATVVSSINGIIDKIKYIEIVDIITFIDNGFRKFTFIDLSSFCLTLRRATKINSVKSSTSDRSTPMPATSMTSLRSTSKTSLQSYQPWFHSLHQHHRIQFFS